MNKPGHQTLVLTAQDVARLLPMTVCVDAVERAFKQLGEGNAEPPVTVAIHSGGGGFHVKAAVLDLGRRYFAVKSNGNFPANHTLHGLPTIQGLVMLCDADDGRVLAVIDSIEITARRTAAATAVAAKYLARSDARVAVICGCGYQAQSQLDALTTVLPLEEVVVYDVDHARAGRFAMTMSERCRVNVQATDLAEAAARLPDVWVTCTTSTEFFLQPAHVKPGAFVAGVGVDSEHKQELAPTLLARAHVVTDRTQQCEQIGDLHHALAAGITPRSIVELGDVVAGRTPGRAQPDDIYVFDSTGIAVQDVAAAAAVFEAAESLQHAGGAVTAIAFA